jgi:type II secretory pathway pseudopilin PulG
VKTLRERRDESEAGFTLPELLVYCILLAVVMTAIGSLLISSLRTERTVDRVVSASTEAQIAIKSIQYGVRNASAHVLPTLTNANQLLLARVAKPDVADLEWSCRAWYYDAVKHEIRYRESDLAIAEPSSAELKNWTLLADEVTPMSGTKIFGLSGTQEVTVGFTVATGGDDPSVDIKTSVVRRVTTWESTGCF